MHTDCSISSSLESDTLRISTEIKSNAVCNLTISPPNQESPLVLFIDSVILAKNDQVQVFQNSTILIANVSSSGFLFLHPNSTTTIRLNSSAISYNRVLSLSYSYNSHLSLLLSQSTTITTLTYAGKFYDKSLKLTLNLLAAKMSATADDKKILAIVNSLSNDTNVKFETEDYSRNLDYLSASSTLTVTLDMKKLSPKPFDIFFDLVNGKCSEVKQLDEASPSFSIDSSEAQKSQDILKCLWIVYLKDDDTNAVLNLNYENPLFNNNLETYVIRNGSLSTSPVITTLFKSNIEEVKNSLANSILNAKSLHITFTGYYQNPSTVQGYFNVTRSENSRLYYSEAKLNLKPNEKIKGPIIILFKSNLEQALLTVTTQTLTNTDLSIYSSLDAHDEDLIATFKPHDVLPSTIWSPTKFMALKFSKLDSFQGMLSSSKMTQNRVASGAQSSYLLQSSELDCGQSVEWLIPANSKGKGDMISLVISSLRLEDKSSLKVVNVNNKTTLFELTGVGDPQLQTLPTLLLGNSTSHSVVYTRGSAANCDITHTLMQSTVGLIHYDECKVTYDLTPSKNLTIFSVNYPNNYSLLESTLTQQCNSIKSNTSLIYWSFQDLDLAYDLGHYLSIEGSNFDPIKVSKDLPDDFISPSSIALNFQRSLSSKQLNENAKLSGKGFKANLEAITCGQSLVNEKSHFLILNSTELANDSKCIYIIKSKKKEQVITLKMNKVPESLLIYDTNSLRTPRLLNMSYLANETIKSSTDTLILTYMVDHQNTYNISINYSGK